MTERPSGAQALIPDHVRRRIGEAVTDPGSVIARESLADGRAHPSVDRWRQMAVLAVLTEWLSPPMAFTAGAVRVVATDVLSGQSDVRLITDDVCVVVAGSCRVVDVADYPKVGTQVWTIKGRGGRHEAD